MKSCIKRVSVFLSSLVVSALAILFLGIKVQASNFTAYDALNANNFSQLTQLNATNVEITITVTGNSFPLSISGGDVGVVLFGPVSSTFASSTNGQMTLTCDSNHHIIDVDARTNWNPVNIAPDTTTQCTVTISFDVNGVHYEDVKNGVPITSGASKDFGGAWVFSGGLNRTSTGDSSGNGGSGENPSVSQFYQHINDTVNEIGLAAQGLNADGSVNETKTVFYSAPSVYSSIIKAVMNAEGVTFFVTYEFDGYVFCSAITPELASAMYSEDIPWYGPAYIATYCPTVMIGAVV